MSLILALLALQDLPEAEILRAAEAGGGLAVLLGAGDGALAERLASRGAWVVHALEPDPARAAEVRRRLAAAGLGGRATVEHAAWPALPYGELLVNVLVAAEPAVDDAEILRVLAPEGRAWVRRDGRWSALRKPRPSEFDEWTHSRHGADGNMVSRDLAVAAPQGIRWIAGPAQDDGGRKWYYDHILVSARGRNVYATEEGLLARDAANGVLLWSRAFKAPAVREKGLPLPLDGSLKPSVKLGQRATRVRPVAHGDVLYLAEGAELLELDARTGETRAKLGTLRDPRDLLVDGGLLVASDADAVRAWTLETRAPAWTAEVDFRRMAATDGGVFGVTATDVVRLDRATGKETWRTPDVDAALALSLTAKEGFLVLEKSTLRDDGSGCGIRVYGTDDGVLRWTRDYKPDMTHYREARAYFARGLLWIQADKDKLLGLDPKSGSERQAWGSRGKHCASPVATERFFMAPECEFTDFETGARTRSRIFKSACRLPFIPANGLLYTFPVQCECFPMLRGYMALAPTPPSTSLAALPRLSIAAAAEAPLLTPAEALDAEWPTYRHDAHRSGATPMALSAGPLKVAWRAEAVSPPEGPLAAEWRANPYVRGPLTPPVAAAGRVIVAAPDRHLVLAFDAKDGRRLWSFEADGRVDLPPTVHEGLCLFGGRDGRVYALRVSDGALAWRLRVAPREARLPAWGQLESPWPVVGSVLVVGDTGYAAAGRHPSADGGVKVLAFRAKTGEVLWDRTIDNIDFIKNWYGPTLPNSRIKVGLDFEPVDCLVRDGDFVAMSRWRFAPATGEMTTAWDVVKYRSPGLEVPRGLWGYGIRQTKAVRPKPPAAFDASGLKQGTSDDAAVLLAGGRLVTATRGGELRVGDQAVPLGAAAVHDGLCAAYGRVYAATLQGTLIAVE